jgi:hypothetical protein
VGSAVGWPTTLFLVSLLATVVASIAGVSLRTWARSAALHRDLPLSPVSTRLALLVAPALVTGTWSLAALALARQPLWLAVAVTAAGMAALLVRAEPRSDIGAGGLLATPAGPLPIGLVRQVLLTPAVAVLMVAPIALIASPPILLAPILGLAWLVLRS